MSLGEDRRLIEWIQRGTGADGVELGARVQSLWSGYGEVRRVELSGGRPRSAIVKWVAPPEEREFARDAAKLRSHRRKLRSYAVELSFYRAYAPVTDETCRVPALLFGESNATQVLFVFEDLDAAGFPARRARVADSEIVAGLLWLASFHHASSVLRPKDFGRSGRTGTSRRGPMNWLASASMLCAARLPASMNG